MNLSGGPHPAPGPPVEQPCSRVTFAAVTQEIAADFLGYQPAFKVAEGACQSDHQADQLRIRPITIIDTRTTKSTTHSVIQCTPSNRAGSSEDLPASMTGGTPTLACRADPYQIGIITSHKLREHSGHSWESNFLPTDLKPLLTCLGK